MPVKRRKLIRCCAIKVRQNDHHPLYLFTLTSEELFQVADISRIARDDAGRRIGYQRPEVKRHIRNIVEYLNSDDILFPNSLILSLSREAKFTKSHDPKINGNLARTGILTIPIPRDGKHKPGWIVDGQQRALAFLKSKRTHFPIPISGFVADDISLQRDQFLRVNATKPLPRGLITELLPDVTSVLPAHLAARKIPSALCDLLNEDPESPFRNLIRRSSMSKAQRGRAVISDTAMVHVLRESLSSPSGCLFPYRNMATQAMDLKGVRSVLLIYWNAVRDVFPKAWGLSPMQSRLMHSAGIRAMGKLMDRMMSSVDPQDRHAEHKVRQELARLHPFCRWTSGTWEEVSGLRWDEVQNVPSHIKTLSNYLVRTYLSLSQRAK